MYKELNNHTTIQHKNCVIISSHNHKKIWNRVDSQRSEKKKIQNTQEIKRMLFNWMKQDNNIVLFHPVKKHSFNLLCVLDHTITAVELELQSIMPKYQPLQTGRNADTPVHSLRNNFQL